MARPPASEFDVLVARALAEVGAKASDQALDALAAPSQAAAALAELNQGEPFLFRVAPPLRAATSTHGPEPQEPLWLRGISGANALRLASLRLRENEKGREVHAASVVVTAEEDRCCDAASCSSRRTLAAAWIELEGAEATARRLLVAEIADLDPSRARARVAAIAAPLARALAVPVLPNGLEEALDAPPGLPPAPPSPPLAAGPLARFAMRVEGERFVLRDHDDKGPRATAKQKAIVGAILLAISLALWFEAARALQRGDRNVTIGLGATAALLTLVGYAFTSVARFGSRYDAPSTPIFWAGRDRFVIAPWVSRSGAVDRSPEGRLGAAIALEEVREVHAISRDGRPAVEIDSDHGPMDVLLAESGELASFWSLAVERALGDVAHPKARASAKKRARERAGA